MQDIKKMRKRIWESFIVTILLILFAILLFMNPGNFMNSAIQMFGYLGILFGVIEVFMYFRLPLEARDFTNNLANGIVLILYGVMGILKADLLKEVFPVLLGGYLIFKNAARFQLGVSLKTDSSKIGVSILLLSFLTLLLSVLLVLNPFDGIYPLHMVIAILVFLCEGIYGIENFILLFGVKQKEQESIE